VLYVSPLKALAADIERNLRAPLAGIHSTALRMGMDVRLPSAFVRTGDTPAKDRVGMRRSPPDILITTPESLFLVLTSGARELLRSVDTVIIDEIHSLVASKRGAHLSLSLERLEELRESQTPLQRIGLSATQRPLEEVARFLAGFEPRSDPSAAASRRLVAIVDARTSKLSDVRVEAPDVDMNKLGGNEGAPSRRKPGAGGRSIWPSLHEQIVRLVQAHRSTMIFVNSRRLAERVAAALNLLSGCELALAHHGAVAKDQRAIIEDRLKRGDLRAIVATSSLELGIDMGSVDLVVQVESPPSVASGLQRIGRSGHSVGRTSLGVLIPKHRGDLLACAAAVAAMRAGEVESTFYPRNPLDVLAQQIVAIAVDGSIDEAQLLSLVRRAAPFAELPVSAFEGVLDMLSGRYAAGEFAGLRARTTWDRVGGRVKAREGARRIAIANGGTIPDRGLYGVFLGSQTDAATESTGRSRRVGELDEEMVFELRTGDVFFLGASSWRTDAIQGDRVLVSPAPGEPGKMPFWHGDRAARPLPFGRAIGALTRELLELEPREAQARLEGAHAMNVSASANLLAYLTAQREEGAAVPTDHTLVLERWVEGTGDHRVCLLSPLGGRVHAPWCAAVIERLSKEGIRAEGVFSDDGIVFRTPEAAGVPAAEWFFPTSSEVASLVTDSLRRSPLFASRFREAASRALLLPRGRPGQRTPLWIQRKRAADLLAVASGYPDFPVLLEAYRECLSDEFDMAGLVETLRQIEYSQIQLVVSDSVAPSPFASSLLLSFVAQFIYEGDAPVGELRAQALAIDQERLRALLGDVELRSVLDPTVLREHVERLSRSGRSVRHGDDLHDLLLALGDLSALEIASRSTREPAGWIAELVATGRAFSFEIRGETRYAAIEDAGRLRAALGVSVPSGTPVAFLAHGPDVMRELVARYARTHGPFTLVEVADRFGVEEDKVRGAVLELVSRRQLVCGEFTLKGLSAEYTSPEILEGWRRASLARTRRSVEPVVGEGYARFLVEWQVSRRRGPDALLDVVRQLEGCPLLASALEDQILPARVVGYRPWDLDALCTSGAVVWAGIEPVGARDARDGRIALYLAEHESCLARPVKQATGIVAGKIRDLLTARGATFYSEIARALGGFPAELEAGLWELVWSGEVTNDTLAVLRARRSATGDRHRRLARGAPAAGRWSLRRTRWGSTPSVTDRRAALARTLVHRYGVVGREWTEAEGVAGGFSEVYGVLKSMEDAGRVRRGYFVAPLCAAQFADPAAVERLRAFRDPSLRPRTVVLAATDPANVYGSALPWPPAILSRAENLPHGSGPQRTAGARVVMYDGDLIAWLGRGGETLLTWIDARREDHGHLSRRLAEALAALVDDGKKNVLLIRSIDGLHPTASPLLGAFLAVGFRSGSKGLQRRRFEALGAAADGSKDLLS
jgi:ATP-dependent Lhr-like helicase